MVKMRSIMMSGMTALALIMFVQMSSTFLHDLVSKT